MCLDPAGGKLLYTPEKVQNYPGVLCPAQPVAHGIPIPPGADPQPDKHEDAQSNVGLPVRAAVLARYDIMLFCW